LASGRDRRNSIAITFSIRDGVFRGASGATASRRNSNQLQSWGSIRATGVDQIAAA
jgi:hypothetical protein